MPESYLSRRPSQTQTGRKHGSSGLETLVCRHMMTTTGPRTASNASTHTLMPRVCHSRAAPIPQCFCIIDPVDRVRSPFRNSLVALNTQCPWKTPMYHVPAGGTPEKWETGPSGWQLLQGLPKGGCKEYCFGVLSPLVLAACSSRSPYPASQDQSNESREARVKPTETESKENSPPSPCSVYIFRLWEGMESEGPGGMQSALLCACDLSSSLFSTVVGQGMILKTDAVAWLSAA